MSGTVQFHQDDAHTPVRTKKKRADLQDWIISHSNGRVTSRGGATLLAVIFIIALLGASFLINSSSNQEAKLVAPPGREIIDDGKSPPRLK